MRTLILLALVGFGAQLVDGSLGMAYGVTSSTLLLAVGLAPATVSATVHLARGGHHARLGCSALEIRQHRLARGPVHGGARRHRGVLRGSRAHPFGSCRGAGDVHGAAGPGHFCGVAVPDHP